MRPVYVVKATVRNDLCESFERFMLERHVPDLMETGSFLRAAIYRTSQGQYHALYEAHDHQSLEDYLTHNAPALREHLLLLFPEGVSLSREEWTALAAWTGG